VLTRYALGRPFKITILRVVIRKVKEELGSVPKISNSHLAFSVRQNISADQVSMSDFVFMQVAKSNRNFNQEVTNHAFVKGTKLV
jgi:hypothetical protein